MLLSNVSRKDKQKQNIKRYLTIYKILFIDVEK